MLSEDESSKDAVDPAHDNCQNNAEMSGDCPEKKRSARERSLSVPCSSEASSNSVDSVMAKAKRASSFLWMLLHSQVGAIHCSSYLQLTFTQLMECSPVLYFLFPPSVRFRIVVWVSIAALMPAVPMPSWFICI